ncbi:hypothetical protein SDC9_201998 [bioreactor metagenome]|uniref:Uncharacterized protein n=1 Tax=bioreactor metagenome TaxID=1076179 RepID=A0A645ISG7_9ZZZZ
MIAKEAKTVNANNITYDTLKSKGILTPQNDINRDKINLISGAVTIPFLETLFTFSGNNAGTMDRVSAIFTHLYSEGREVEMLAVLRILYDVAGLQFPEDVELLAGHPEARQYFLFSFLLDMDDFLPL